MQDESIVILLITDLFSYSACVDTTTLIYEHREGKSYYDASSPEASSKSNEHNRYLSKQYQINQII